MGNKFKKLTYKLFSHISYVYLVKYYLEDFLASKKYFIIKDKRKNPWDGLPSIAFSNSVNVLIFYFDWKENHFGFFLYKESSLEENTKSVFEIEYLNEKDLYRIYNIPHPTIEELTNVRQFSKNEILQNQLCFLKKIL